jgi:hypothetical protein
MPNWQKMIKPDRHINPEISVLNIGAFILGKLNAFYDISYDKLMQEVVDNIGEGAIENYPYAINFLYLLGKIEYIEASDSFRYNNAAK